MTNQARTEVFAKEVYFIYYWASAPNANFLKNKRVREARSSKNRSHRST
jgi:hypothetical protein